MHSPLLPHWLSLLWTVVLCGVAALHVGHSVSMHGQRRWWHAGHTVMALSMAGMYALPRMSHPALYRDGLALFALLTVVLAATAALISSREGRWNPAWVAAAVDTLVMAYMLSPAPGPWPLTWLFLGYLAVATLGWLLNWWPRAATAHPAATGVTLTAHSSRTVTTTLAIMTAGMAYMLAAR